MSLAEIQSMKALKLAKQSSAILTQPTVGKNLFNKENIMPHVYINYTNGGLSPEAAGFPANASGFIPINPNQTYTINFNDGIAFYDSNYGFINGLYATNTFTAPASTAYIRVTAMGNHIEALQLESGSSSTSYESYRVTYGNSNTNVLSGDFIQDYSIPVTKIKDQRKTRNLFNKANATNGYYINTSNGTLSAQVLPFLYYASDFIPVLPNVKYTRSTTDQMAFYDSNRAFISGGNLSNPFTVPSNARYVKVSVKASLLDTFQLELGTVASTYEPYGYYLNNVIPPTVPYTMNIVIPNTVYVAVGRTLEIYDSQILETPRKDVYVVYSGTGGSIGKQLRRKYQITGTSGNMGTYTLTIKVYDYDMNLLASKNVTLIIATKTLSTTKNVLCVGDSLTDIVTWRQEIYDNLASAMFGTGKINYIGTKGTTPYLHEGMSGWKTSDFLANTNYTYGGNIILTVGSVTTIPQSKKQYTVPDDQGGHAWEFEKAVGNQYYFNRLTNGTYNITTSGSITQVDSGTVPGDATISFTNWAWQPGNPFWNTTTNQLDFRNYLTQNSFPDPDLVIFFLGANDLSVDFGGNRNAIRYGLAAASTNMKTLVDKVRSQIPNAKVFVVQIPFWAPQDGLGKNYTNMDVNSQRSMDIRVFIYNQLLMDTFAAYDSNTQIVAVGQTMDRENVYTMTSTVVNPRASLTEMQATGGVHPDSTGFKQIADSIFSHMAGVI